MSTHPTSQTHSSIWFRVLNALLTLGVIIGFGAIAIAAIIILSQALPLTGAKAYWFISRSSGVLAYLLLTLGVMWGLIQSSGIGRPSIPIPMKPMDFSVFIATRCHPSRKIVAWSACDTRPRTNTVGSRCMACQLNFAERGFLLRRAFRSLSVSPLGNCPQT